MMVIVGRRQLMLLCALLTLLISTNGNTAFSAAVAKKTDPFSRDHQLTVVMMVSTDTSDYWSANGASLKISLQQALTDAMGFWKRVSLNKFKYSVTYILAPPTASLAHCDTQGDWRVGKGIAKLKSLTWYQHLIVVNPLDTCGYTGYAEVQGSHISIKSVSATNIAHEFGHNLGFSHSGSVFCPNDNFLAITSKCTIDQYGDNTDLMGGGVIFDKAIMGVSQLSSVFGSPVPKYVNPGSYVATNYSVKSREPILAFKTANGTVLLEYSDATQNGGLRVATSDSPGIEVRLVGSSVMQRGRISTESGIGTLTLARLRSSDSSGSCTASCHVDLRFHPGDSVNIPFTNYVLYVGSGDAQGLKVVIATRAQAAASLPPAAPVVTTPAVTVIKEGEVLSWMMPAPSTNVAGFLILALPPIGVGMDEPMTPIVIGFTDATRRAFALPSTVFSGRSLTSFAVVAFDKFGHRSPAKYLDFGTS